MPNIIAVIKTLGGSLPDEVTNETIFAALKESSDFKGLSDKNRELLAKNVELKNEKSERDELDKDRENNELKLARDKGNLEAEVAILRKRVEDAEAKESSRTEALRVEAHKTAQMSVVELFSDKTFAKYLAKSDVVTELDDLGEPVSKYMLDGVAYNDINEWKSFAAKNPDYASRMPVGGANNSPSATGSIAAQAATTKKPSEYSEAERVSLYREDPAKFKELFGR